MLLSPRLLYFQISTESTVFPTEPRINWDSPISTQSIDPSSHGGHGSKSVARVLRARNVDDAYDEECIVMKNAQRADLQTRSLKPARCISIWWNRAIRRARVLPIVRHGAPEAEQPASLLSLADNGYPRNSRHRSAIRSLDLFFHIYLSSFFFLLPPLPPLFLLLSLWRKGGDFDCASEEMPTDRFRIPRWSSIFIPCS